MSDPAERPRGRRSEARAGSLTPYLYSGSFAGALNGRHKAPPDQNEHSGVEVGVIQQVAKQRTPAGDRVYLCPGGELSNPGGANRALG